MSEVTVKKSVREELALFVEFEKGKDTSEYIIPYSLDKHQACFDTPGVIYLSILCDGKVVGFFILCREAEAVEFRRVVIESSARGIGKLAIAAMEAYCKTRLSAQKVWLDVFEHNKRGIYIYEKAGYSKTGDAEFEGKRLLIMEKALTALCG